MHYSNWRVVGPVRSVFTFLLTRHYLSSRVLSWPSRAKFPTLPPRSGVWRGADKASMGADRPCISKWGTPFRNARRVVRRGITVWLVGAFISAPRKARLLGSLDGPVFEAPRFAHLVAEFVDPAPQFGPRVNVHDSLLY